MKVLNTPLEVLELIKNDKAICIDVRKEEEYLTGHIPGAVNIHEFFTYLAKSDEDGINELRIHFENIFSEKGMDFSKPIVVYEERLDTLYGSSCRGYFLLRLFGHQSCGILNGGLKAWINQGLKLTQVIPDLGKTQVHLEIDFSVLATKKDVLNALGNPEIKLLDDRDKDEWDAKSSSPYGVDFTPRKGKIPGAIWIEWYDFMDTSLPSPEFKTNEEIIKLCESKNIYKNDPIIVYCFKGSRASNTFIALQKAGFTNVRNYFSSWNEWSRDFNLPID
ncbi:MAG: sulfurtransferase [Spirochaetes bacterium]|nr:sulfurtransferase [Spirochaetota bacterium]